MYVTHCGKMHMDEISSKENVTSSEIYRGGWSKMHRKTCGTDSAYLAPTSTMIFTSHPIKSFQIQHVIFALMEQNYYFYNSPIQTILMEWKHFLTEQFVQN